VAGVVALIMAINAERKIKDSGGRLTGLDQARIAKVIAIVQLALVALAVVLLGLIVIFASGGSNTSYLGLAATVPLVARWTGTARTR